ncbi:tetraacyldisaccharide 4'-kinase [Rufibacter ruber]|uniref:tetraacyldisaccharide 4'-kinase n=1 Tax=Rufibacter ruber TaxID=1783499 RepID=UPI000837A1D5|nr:tetraacyldisaccharide 4'-kinase [Rufibacter ruber]
MLSVLRPFRFLLLPFAWGYGGVVWLRNKLYDWQVYNTYAAPIPVVCVGNLTVGGTGKTPQVEYLARLFKGKKMAILSRGYKRKTKGFVLADASATAATLGDEPFQYVQSLPWAAVAVCERRAAGIQQLLQLFPDLELILLDDAFQHRAVKAKVNLLLTDYGRLFTKDFLLPVGLLREPKAGAGRADAVVVTKCPAALSNQQQQAITAQIALYTRSSTPIFFSYIQYAPAVPIGAAATLGKKLVLVTGIANAQPLLDYLKKQGHDVVHHFEWADHSDLTHSKLEEVVSFFGKSGQPAESIVMTQKDAVKWQTPAFLPVWQNLPVFYIPIEVAFTSRKPSFEPTMKQLVFPEGSDNNF